MSAYIEIWLEQETPWKSARKFGGLDDSNEKEDRWGDFG